MCAMLASEYGATGEELLQQAKDTLHSLDAVLFVDNFAEDSAKLFKRLNLRLTKVVRANTTKKYQFSPELIERIRQDNALDIRLYEYALEHFKPH